MPRAKTALKPQMPGANPGPVPVIDPASVPASFLDEIRLLTNEGLIALDTAERSGENRGEYLDAIDAELQGRIKAEQGRGDEVVKDAEPAPVRVALESQPPLNPAIFGLPRAADIDLSKLTSAVLTQEGWLVPSAPTPPPIR